MGGVAIFFGLAVAMLVRYGVEQCGRTKSPFLLAYLSISFWIVGICGNFLDRLARRHFLSSLLKLAEIR